MVTRIIVRGPRPTTPLIIASPVAGSGTQLRVELFQASTTFSPPLTYRLYSSPTQNGTYTLLASGTNIFPYTHSGLPEGATRWYEVEAADAQDPVRVSDRSPRVFSTANDITPLMPVFDQLNGMPLNQPLTSGWEQVTGFNTSLPISVTNGEYAVSSVPVANPVFTSAPGTISGNQYVNLRMQTPSTAATAKTVTLNIGGFTTNWTISTAGASTQVFRNYPIMNISIQQANLLDGMLTTRNRVFSGEKDLVMWQWFKPTQSRLEARVPGFEWIRANYPFCRLVMYCILQEAEYDYTGSDPRDHVTETINHPTEGNPNWWLRRLGGSGIVSAHFDPINFRQANVSSAGGLNSLGETYPQAYFRRLRATMNATYGPYSNFWNQFIDGIFVDVCNIRAPFFYAERTNTLISDQDMNNNGVADPVADYSGGANAGGTMWEQGAIDIKDTIKSLFGNNFIMMPNGARWAYNYFDGGGTPPPMGQRLSFGEWPDLILSESVNNQLGISKIAETSYSYNGGGSINTHFWRTAIQRAALGPDAGSALGRSAVVIHATTHDRTPNADDREFARFILGLALMVEQCAPAVSQAAREAIPLDDLFFQLGAPLSTRTMGTYNAATGSWSGLRSPDLIVGVGRFWWVRTMQGLVVLRGDNPSVNPWPNTDAAVTCTLPTPPSGQAYAAFPPIYTNPITGYTTRNQDPSINHGGVVTSVAMRPYTCRLFRTVPA